MPRLVRGIQYAAAPRFNHCRLWNTGSPAFADDDICNVATALAWGGQSEARPPPAPRDESWRAPRFRAFAHPTRLCRRLRKHLHERLDRAGDLFFRHMPGGAVVGSIVAARVRAGPSEHLE